MYYSGYNNTLKVRAKNIIMYPILVMVAVSKTVGSYLKEYLLFTTLKF